MQTVDSNVANAGHLGTGVCKESGCPLLTPESQGWTIELEVCAAL